MFIAISDVHIQEQGDPAHQLLMSFFRSREADECHEIYLLGDIFDVMVGTHLIYFERFPEFFDEIERLLRAGKIIHFLEGNHDMHLEQLFGIFLDRRNLGHLKYTQFIYHDTFIETKYWGKSLLLCHGDDIELGNIGYKRYRRFVGTKFIQFLAEEIIPYWFIRDVAGDNAKASRKRNKDKYSHDTARIDIRDSFREAAIQARVDRDYDYIICGHSHEKDLYVSEEGFTYLNNGYALNSKTFLVMDKSGPRFQAIEEQS
jgi:UDP-2,3-diacylglucosamine hydrolase